VAGAEPGWEAKLSRYPGATEDEMRAHEQIEMMHGYIARAESAITSLRDLNDNNYYVDPNETTHLKKLIVDEFEMPNGAVINNLNVDQLTFGDATGNGMYPDDIVCSTIRVNQSASINQATADALQTIANANVEMGGGTIQNGRATNMLVTTGSRLNNVTIESNCRFGNSSVSNVLQALVEMNEAIEWLKENSGGGGLF